MQVGGIGNESRNGNSGLDNRGVFHQSINYRVDDQTQGAYRRDTARRDVVDEATSAYSVSFSSEGKRLAAERLAGRKTAERESAVQEQSTDRERDKGQTQTGQGSGGVSGKLRELLESGKRLLLQIWNGNKAEKTAEETDATDDKNAVSASSEEEDIALREDKADVEEANDGFGEDEAGVEAYNGFRGGRIASGKGPVPDEADGTPGGDGAAADVLKGGIGELTDLGMINGEAYHESGIAAAAANVLAPRSVASSDPYFNSNSDAGKVKESLLVRIRIRFRDILGQLAERFGGMLSGQFSAGSELKDGQRRQKDNLQAKQAAQEKRQKEYYRKNGVVVDVNVSQGEHLMDSYGKTGEYSKLTTGQKR